MKRILISFSWMFLCISNMAQGGQHTGVGGNPIPPPNGPNDAPPPVVVPNLTPLGVLYFPVALEETDSGNGPTKGSEPAPTPSEGK